VGSVIRERIQDGDDTDLNACLPWGRLRMIWQFAAGAVLIKIKALPTEQWAYFQAIGAAKHT